MASHPFARRSQGIGVERWSLGAAVAIMAVWGVNFTFVKYVLDKIGVGPFLFIRFLTMPLLGFLLLALVYRRHLAKSWPLREDLPRFIACGLVGHTAHVGLVTWGIDLSTAFSSALVLTSGPLFTLLILAWAGVEKLRRRQLAGTFAACESSGAPASSRRSMASNWSFISCLIVSSVAPSRWRILIASSCSRCR